MDNALVIKLFTNTYFSSQRVWRQRWYCGWGFCFLITKDWKAWRAGAEWFHQVCSVVPHCRPWKEHSHRAGSKDNKHRMLKRNDIIFGADKGAFPRGCVGLSPGGRLRWVPGRKCPQGGLQSQGRLGTKDPEVGRSLLASVKINPRKSEAVEQFPVHCVGNLTGQTDGNNGTIYYNKQEK